MKLKIKLKNFFLKFIIYFILSFKFIVLLINLSLIFINIYLLIYKNTKEIIEYNEYKQKFLNQIKISDFLPLCFSSKKYLEIGNYLNSKYDVNNLILILNQTTKLKKRVIFKKKRKKILLYSVDLFSLDFHKNWITKRLKDKFIIKFDSNKPDYLIYNIFGSEHLNPKYNNSIKIAILTENKIPNLDEADYVIGHYHINYLDRYFKYNIFFLRNFNNLVISRNKALNSPKRRKFCAALISNNISTDGFRLKFINELNKYKKIDMGGQVNNNIEKTIENKIDFLESYKFSIAMENSEGDGYISEKIYDSFLAGTIPIYYGDYMVDEYINPKAYILIKGEKDMYKKIEYIKQIDNNDEIYNNLLKEKVLLDNNIVIDTEKELKEFLCHIFEQDKIKAFRKMF